MSDKAVKRYFMRQVDLARLVGTYLWLRFQLAYLLAKYHLIKVAGAALIEAVKMEYCIKSLSKEERVIFAASVALSIYCLAFILRIHM